ncbi:MAG: DNA polymerase II [Pseudomonadales bacterium]
MSSALRRHPRDNGGMHHRGVIFQASYRVRSGTDGRPPVPVVHLYGRLDDGRSFLVRDARQRPYFYVRRGDAEGARVACGLQPQVCDLHSLGGEALCRVELRLPADVVAVSDRLHAAGIDTYEADVRFAARYLIDRDIKGCCLIRGESQPGEGVDLVFDDPEVEPDPGPGATSQPRVLAFDIETDPGRDALLAISLYGLGADEVLIVVADAPPPEQVRLLAAEAARLFATEAALLRAFCARVAELDPDVLTGWNVVDFDLAVLARVAERVGQPLCLGRDQDGVRIRAANGYFGSASASIAGRLVLDGIALLRGAFVRTDDYSLDAVARQVLGEGKALEGANHDRLAEILGNYRHDLPAFARYARTDARLPLAILERLDLVTLAFARSRLTGMTPDRVAASIASFDFLYLAALRKRRHAAPTLRAVAARTHTVQAGGHVLEPRVGLHEQVWVFDFKSLYPSLIRTFNIDPMGFVAAPGDMTTNATTDEDLIVLENAVGFRRQPGILPAMLDDLFPRREAAKRSGDAVAAQAIKILMNSFYGVLGTPACRFHNPAIANAITAQGRHFLKWSQAWFEARGYQVLYGDTDSLFVRSNQAEARSAVALAERLVQELNADLRSYVAARWRVDSALELQFEKLYVRLLLPSVRHGSAGARKRYAGQRYGGPPGEVEFVGMEVVRRDWTALAKLVQRELHQRLFADKPLDAYLLEVVSALRRGELDELLVYRKGLRKPVEAYTANTPPHVAAARKSARAPGRIVAYVMTMAGPEPLDARTAPVDREHYLQRQVRPVAEPVLQSVGLDFDQVIGDDRQLGLF